MLAVASGGANYWLQTTNGALETGWDVLTGQITLFYGMMFFSTGVALLGAAVWRPEHRSSSWNRVLTTGRSPVSLVLMKSVVILLLVVLGVSEMRVDWGGVRTLHSVELDPGLVEAVVSARDIEQGHNRDLMAPLRAGR